MSEYRHEVLVVDYMSEAELDRYHTHFVSRIGEEIVINGKLYSVKRVINITSSSYIKMYVTESSFLSF